MTASRCETKQLYVAKVGCMAPKFRKFEIFENIEAGEGFGRPKSRNFFAGANFIASRRRGSHFKCLVEWLHRRGIASAGAIAHTNALVQYMFLRPLGRISVVETNGPRTSFLPIRLQHV